MYRAILSNRLYMAMWAGSLVSQFGDRFTEFGLAWYVLGRSQNPLDLGLAFLVFRLPGLFSGVLAGWLLDRFRREAVMLVDNLLRGGLVALVPILDGSGLLSLPLLYLIIALLGALSVVTVVGSRALITDLVPPEEYNAANSLDVVQGQLGAIAGPGLAGVLVALIGPLALLWIDSFSFFFFALVLLWLLRTPRAATQTEGNMVFFKQLIEGVRFTFRSPLLLALLSVSFWWNFGLGVFNVALPFYCNGPLGVGPAGMGALLAVNSTGVLISALLFGPMRPHYPGRVTCALLIVQAVCYGLMGLTSAFWLVLIIYFVLGVFDDLGAIYLTTIRQRAVPGPLQGRVLAFTGTVGPSGTPFGNGIAGLILGGLGASAVVASAGLPLLVIGLLWLLVGPLRRVVDKV